VTKGLKNFNLTTKC